MFSLIVSVKDNKKLNSILLPSLNNLHKYLYDNHLPDLQLITVSGERSLSKNYNQGITQSIWKTKFFIHEDVDIRDSQIPLFFKVQSLFNLFPDTGLVGLVGTTETPQGFWWNCKRESIVGHVFCNGEYLRWNVDELYYDVKIIDGMFMATNTDVKFSEDIEGFDFYDCDYSSTIRRMGYEIKVLTHLVDHKSTIKNLSNANADYYNKKWSSYFKWNIETKPAIEPNTKLLVMCSSHNRPDRVQDTIKSFNETKSEGTELIIYVGENDPKIEEYRKALKELNQKHIIGPYKTMVEVLNCLSCEYYPDLPYYAEVNDDHIYRTKSWDKKLIEAIDKKKGWAISYGFTENLPTAIMISGKLVKTLGFFLPPNFLHTFVDNYILDIGNALDLLIQVPDVVVDHMHYIFGKAELDDNYKFVSQASTLIKGEEDFRYWRENCRENDINKIKTAMEQENA
jgi:Glycosyltransferase like family